MYITIYYSALTDFKISNTVPRTKINTTKRTTQGVKLIDLPSNEKVLKLTENNIEETNVEETNIEEGE